MNLDIKSYDLFEMEMEDVKKNSKKEFWLRSI